MDDHRRPQLPALSYLQDDKIKREEEAAYQHRNTGGTGTPQSLSTTSSGASPTYHYPPGPPPPYTHAHGPPPTNSWLSANAAVHTPPESRRTSEHEKEMAKPRQSLPSISEALGGVDNQSPFASTAAHPPALHPTHLPQPPTSAASPPAPRRSYPMEPPQATPASYAGSNTYSQYSSYRPEPSRQSSYPPPETAARPAPAAYPPVLETNPQLQLQTPQAQSRPLPPQTTAFARGPETSPKYEQSSTGSMAPPSSSTFTYGYTQYSSRYAEPTPPASTASGPIYQPSAHFGAPQVPQPGARYDERQSTMASHDNNVKRHLDFFDLEAALNEISSTSGILSDFSRRYGDRMHGTQRSGVTPQTLPGVVEIDDMINKSRVAHESLMKIRDVVLQQQAVYEQQAADQRQQHKGFEQHHVSQPAHHLQEADDSKAGGFAGADTKKRRGRAAPPGRCHSCNRAETPEWRRGPDGARTLCNACGLHYAKLTRKNNGANKTTTAGSSNLQPKQN